MEIKPANEAEVAPPRDDPQGDQQRICSLFPRGSTPQAPEDERPLWECHPVDPAWSSGRRPGYLFAVPFASGIVRVGYRTLHYLYRCDLLQSCNKKKFKKYGFQKTKQIRFAFLATCKIDPPKSQKAFRANMQNAK